MTRLYCTRFLLRINLYCGFMNQELTKRTNNNLCRAHGGYGQLFFLRTSNHHLLESKLPDLILRLVSGVLGSNISWLSNAPESVLPTLSVNSNYEVDLISHCGWESGCGKSLERYKYQGLPHSPFQILSPGTNYPIRFKSLHINSLLVL